MIEKIQNLLNSRIFWEILFVCLVIILFVDYFFLQMSDQKSEFILSTFKNIKRLILKIF